MINDTINPLELNPTKNLHGHVRVELRDRWTGRIVDSQEKDNLVTNAAQKLFPVITWLYYNGQYVTPPASVGYLPLFEKFLGGLLLFNGTLTESATNIHFPANVSLVGYAGQDSNADNPLRGSYNTQESVYTSTGFTTTWDFLTSQANGTIASLARTHFEFPRRSFIYLDATLAAGRSDALGGYSYLGYDETNHYLYVAPKGNQTVNGVTYPVTNIYRTKIDFSKISLLGSYLTPATNMTLIKTLTSGEGTTNAYEYNYDKYANNFVYANYYGNDMHFIAMDGTHTSATVSLPGSNYSLAITENYYWRSNGTALYRFSKTNLADSQTYTLPNNGEMLPMENDMIYVARVNGSSTNSNVIVYPNGTMIETPYISGLAYSMREAGPFWTGTAWNNAGTLIPRSNYLGTIANLNSPVTKTSSQTMKITYTLTEA